MIGWVSKIAMQLANLINFSYKITFPNESLGIYEKATNAVISTFVAFVFAKALCTILYILLKTQSYQGFERFFTHAASSPILHKKLYIYFVFKC